MWLSLSEITHQFIEKQRIRISITFCYIIKVISQNYCTLIFYISGIFMFKRHSQAFHLIKLKLFVLKLKSNKKLQ